MQKYLLSRNWMVFARLIERAGLWYLPFGFALGLYWSLVWAPVDVVQGEVYRIMYVHVPCAMLSLLVYLCVGFLSLGFLIWRVKFFEQVAWAINPLGLGLTAFALLSGMLWGKPTWGTYWIWDARLTSELVLGLFYLAIELIRDSRLLARRRLAAAIAVLGLVNLPIVHYSVTWWNTLHQGPSLFANHQAIDPSMLVPLWLMIVNMAVLIVVMGSLRFQMLEGAKT